MVDDDRARARYLFTIFVFIRMNFSFRLAYLKRFYTLKIYVGILYVRNALIHKKILLRREESHTQHN